jgi:hypothetical protein
VRAFRDGRLIALGPVVAVLALVEVVERGFYRRYPAEVGTASPRTNSGPGIGPYA